MPRPYKITKQGPGKALPNKDEKCKLKNRSGDSERLKYYWFYLRL